LMEWGSRRLAFFGVTFAGVAAAPSLAICAVVEGEEVGGCGSIRWSGRRDAGAGLSVYAR
jgi:hypothetical protein